MSPAKTSPRSSIVQQLGSARLEYVHKQECPSCDGVQDHTVTFPASTIACHGCKGNRPLQPEELEVLEDALQRAIEKMRSSQHDEPAIQPPPNAFPEGRGNLPNNPLVAAGLQSIWKGGPGARSQMSGWSTNEAGGLVYKHQGNRGGRILVYPNLVSADALPTTENLWAFVESLNPFTADVALAVLAQMVEPTQGDKPKHPLLEPVRITADAILRYKGIQRWGIERRLHQERIAKEMDNLRALQFDIERYPTFNSETGKLEKGSWKGDRLFDIVKAERYQERLFGEGELIEVAWSVRAGQWAYWWLNAQGRVYLARMARVLLELDHQGSALAKKIGQRLVLLAGAVRGLRDLRIANLLEDVGELPAPEHRGINWAGRTRERFDTAMLSLQEARVLAELSWPDGFGPGDADRSKGWTTRWLNTRVRVTLPDAPPEAPAVRALPGPSYRRPAAVSPEQRMDGAEIRKTRKARGWSQDALAKHLGISPVYLSPIENNKRLPSRDLAKKLRAWLSQT